jgi:hypothetical protein
MSFFERLQLIVIKLVVLKVSILDRVPNDVRACIRSRIEYGEKVRLAAMTREDTFYSVGPPT